MTRAPDSQILVKYPRPDQRLIFFPSSGLKSPIGHAAIFFVIVTVIFLLCFAHACYAVSFDPRGITIDDQVVNGWREGWPVIPVFLIVIGIFAGIAYFMVRAALTREILSIERHRIIMRTIFLKPRNDEIAVRRAGQEAIQAVAFDKEDGNDSPVYKLKFPETEISFGTDLSEDEKDWLESEINQFFRAVDAQVINRAQSL